MFLSKANELQGTKPRPVTHEWLWAVCVLTLCNLETLYFRKEASKLSCDLLRDLDGKKQNSRRDGWRFCAVIKYTEIKFFADHVKKKEAYNGNT